jgi:hypothetical protein
MAVQRHAGCHGDTRSGYPAAVITPAASAAHVPCAFLRGGREGITGRLLAVGTAVAVIEKDQQALAWADYHQAGERLPGERGEAADEAITEHAAHRTQEAAGTEPSDRQRALHQAQRHATAKAAIDG